MIAKFEPGFFLTIRAGNIAGDERELWLAIEETRELRRFLNDNYRKLRPNKDWENCPYEGHHDDCDCRGTGGDR